MSKFSKEERDDFVVENYGVVSYAQMARVTGWSLTTIKSVARRYGLIESTHIREAIASNPSADHYEIARIAGCKVDNARDTMKAMGLYGPLISTKGQAIPKVESYVYIIKVEQGVYKVGKSDNPHRRFSQLQSNAAEQYEKSELLLSFKTSDALRVEVALRGSFPEYVNTTTFDGYTEWVYSSDEGILARAYEFIEKEYIST